MHIAIVTSGGAGMFCGACMHDNTVAQALMDQDVDVSLIPTYTPLRLDEENHGLNRIFLGGLNVYLNSRFKWWNSLPKFATSWLDHPSVIRLATSFAVSNDASELGELTVSMLDGDSGPYRAAIAELAGFIKQLNPDAVFFSNALLSGAVKEIKRQVSVPIYCQLQGDDVFLDGLPEVYRRQAIDLVSQRAQDFDGFVTHTEFYRRYMANYLSLPVELFSVLPLGIDVDLHPGEPRKGTPERFIVGYFGRMAPEKGLHHLVDAFLLIKEKIPHAQLKIGGQQGKSNQPYLRKTLAKLHDAGVDVTNIGSPDTMREKVHFFSDVDVFSMPTEFLEPKGLPVLEAMANGIPVVQPAHGSFPEMLEATGGGILVKPRDPQALADGILELADCDKRFEFAKAAWEGVRRHYRLPEMAKKMVELVRNS
ncbi:glycosyltransferase family 4 protein [Planctomicrobium sp. SH527]|uniref:glycosyltransferase family 4 protein n=1 Tax=Planctomicrobium sp. SH527 TaxID=3448123 RepID=UPI003F5BDE13